MQQFDQTTTTPLNPSPTTPRQNGPQPLRLEDLQQVSGGSPRGGWNVSQPLSDATESPRGGW
jgi:hypothetical protein